MSNSNKFITIINYIYLFLMINYRFVTNYIIHADHSEYLLLFLSVFVILINHKAIHSLQFSKPIVYWAFWCFFVIVNYYIRPSNIGHISIIRMIRIVFFPLFTMIVTAKEFKDNSQHLLILCVLTLLSFTFLGYYFDSGVLGREFDEESILGNSYAITVCFSLFYLALLQRMNRIPLWLFIILAVVIVFIIATSGTRKAFGASVIMIVFWGVSTLDKKKTGSWVFIIIITILGIRGYNELMDKTFIGQRMEYYEAQQELALPPDAPKFLKLFGDRGAHYYYGFNQFKRNPIFGLGLYNSGVNSRTKYVYLHTEYMAQLADNGIIGFTLFLCFYCWIGKQLLKKRKHDKHLGMVMIGGFIVILFLNLTAWSWSFVSFFMCFGVLIGYCQTNYDINTLKKKV